MTRQDCKAQRVNDQYICDRCGLQWDYDDPEPPQCATISAFGRRVLSELKQLFKETRAKKCQIL